MTVKILTFKKFENSLIKYFLSFILLSSVVILLIDQPDLGQSILLIISWTATVFISGVNNLYYYIFNIFNGFSALLFSAEVWLYYQSSCYFLIKSEINFNQHLR